MPGKGRQVNSQGTYVHTVRLDIMAHVILLTVEWIQIITAYPAAQLTTMTLLASIEMGMSTKMKQNETF